MKGVIHVLSPIQSAIDEFIRGNHLKTVTDLIYIPGEEVVVVERNRKNTNGKYYGRRHFNIDISQAASPSEVVEIIKDRLVVY